MGQKLPVPFSDYGRTRPVADVQRRVNLYPNSGGGLRQYPGLSTLSPADYSQTAAKDISGGTADPLACRWFNSGLTLVVVTKTTFDEWTATSAYDPSTLSFTQSGGSITGINTCDGDWNEDGTSYYTWADTGAVRRYDFSTAGDVSTVGSATGVLTAAQTGWASGHTTMSLLFSANGLVMWLATHFGADASQSYVKQFIIGAPFNPAVATLEKTVISDTTTRNYHLSRSPRGRTIIASDNTSVQELFLRVENDFETAVQTGTTNSQSGDQQGGCYNADGSVFFTIAQTGVNELQSLSAVNYGLFAGSAPSGTLGAAERFRGTPYAVMGSSLYGFTDTGAAFTVGAVTGSESVGMASDGTNLVVTAATRKWAYSLQGGTLTEQDISGDLSEITDTDLGITYTAAYLDSRFFYDQPSGQFVASAVGDPTSIDASDFATSESFGDLMLAVYTHNQLLYLCGQRTTEVWFSSGVGRPPVDRQSVIQRGLIGRRAINSNDNVIYFLDDDRRPNKMVSLDYEAIWTPALGQEFDSYSTVSDCVVSCYSFEQEQFAEFYFPTQDVTWTYHENSQQWTKREDTSNVAFRAGAYVLAYGKVLAFDHTNGKVYELSSSTYQDDSSAITRTADTQILTSEAYGVNGKSMIASEITVTASAETAAGNMSISFTTDPSDLTPTFSTARTVNFIAGTNVYDMSRWGKFREGVFRITTTANTKVELISADVEVEVLDG